MNDENIAGSPNWIKLNEKSKIVRQPREKFIRLDTFGEKPEESGGWELSYFNHERKNYYYFWKQATGNT